MCYATHPETHTTTKTRICKRGFNVTTNPNRIHSLALDHLASPATGAYLSAAIAFLEPSFDCFDRLYIGQADNHNVHDMYCTGLLNASFKYDYIVRSLKAARRFASDHPSRDNYWWYLNYEAAGNYFGTGCSHFEPLESGAAGGLAAEPALPSAPAPALAPAPQHQRQPRPIVSAEQFTSAYIGMFASLTEGLVAIRNTGIMWSPTFNDRTADIGYRPALLGNVTRLFANLPLLTEVANQDAIGKYSLYNVTTGMFRYNLTCTDTVYYQALLTEAAAAAATASATEAAAIKVTVNMELFSRRSTTPQSTITGDPTEHVQRQCCYAAHNLTIGPSWEITDWYHANFAEWNPQTLQ